MIDRDCDASLGTLMWIGDEAHPEFREAFDFCAAQVSQLAVRQDLDEALRRPAASVRWILQAQASRDCSAWHLFDQIGQSYPQASMIQLLATFCEGMRSPVDQSAGCDHVYWHQWKQTLPTWLGCKTTSLGLDHRSSRRVAVIASTFAQAEPLLDVADSAGATAVWCRQGDTRSIRNVDTVWWDDTVATPAPPQVWRERLDDFSHASSDVKHAWIVNSPRLDQTRDAVDGGVDVVLSKPHRIEGLLSMLGENEASVVADLSIASRRAA